MRLSSVISAKADIFQKAFGYREQAVARLDLPSAGTFLPGEGTEAFDAIAEARKDKKRDPRELIAIGVVPTADNSHPDDFDLAILVQQRRLIEHPIVESARRLARGEARVIVTGPATRHSVVNTGRRRPLRIGTSVGHYRITAGTLGCFVQCRVDDRAGILSNNHVLANVNRAAFGDPILQPGRSDGGLVPDDVVARLSRYVPISFVLGTANTVDCAFAALVDNIPYDAKNVGDPARGGWTVGDVDDLVLPQQDVKKMGRTTGLTRGIVTAVNVDNITVSMVVGDPSKMARFDNQIAISGHDGAFSQHGDSGAVVFSSDGALVGLLFAGTDRGGSNGSGLSYANQINTVLDLLDVDVLRA